MEISEIAVKQLFEENGIPYDTSGEFKVHKASDRPMKIITGDYYNLYVVLLKLYGTITPFVLPNLPTVWSMTKVNVQKVPTKLVNTL